MRLLFTAGKRERIFHNYTIPFPPTNDVDEIFRVSILLNKKKNRFHFSFPLIPTTKHKT